MWNRRGLDWLIIGLIGFAARVAGGQAPPTDTSPSLITGEQILRVCSYHDIDSLDAIFADSTAPGKKDTLSWIGSVGRRNAAIPLRRVHYLCTKLVFPSNEQTARDAAKKLWSDRDSIPSAGDVKTIAALVASMRSSRQGRTLSAGRIRFPIGKSDLTPEARAQLHVIAAALSAAGETDSIIVTGWADTVWSGRARDAQARNTELASKRAAAVALALVDEGIGPSRIKAHGEVAKDPRSNTDEYHRELSRTVEIRSSVLAKQLEIPLNAVADKLRHGLTADAIPNSSASSTTLVPSAPKATSGGSFAEIATDVILDKALRTAEVYAAQQAAQTFCRYTTPQAYDAARKSTEQKVLAFQNWRVDSFAVVQQNMQRDLLEADTATRRKKLEEDEQHRTDVAQQRDQRHAVLMDSLNFFVQSLPMPATCELFNQVLLSTAYTPSLSTLQVALRSDAREWPIHLASEGLEVVTNETQNADIARITWVLSRILNSVDELGHGAQIQQLLVDDAMRLKDTLPTLKNAGVAIALQRAAALWNVYQTSVNELNGTFPVDTVRLLALRAAVVDIKDAASTPTFASWSVRSAGPTVDVSKLVTLLVEISDASDTLRKAWQSLRSDSASAAMAGHAGSVLAAAANVTLTALRYDSTTSQLADNVSRFVPLVGAVGRSALAGRFQDAIVSLSRLADTLRIMDSTLVMHDVFARRVNTAIAVADMAEATTSDELTTALSRFNSGNWGYREKRALAHAGRSYVDLNAYAGFESGLDGPKLRSSPASSVYAAAYVPVGVEANRLSTIFRTTAAGRAVVNAITYPAKIRGVGLPFRAAQFLASPITKSPIFLQVFDLGGIAAAKLNSGQPTPNPRLGQVLAPGAFVLKYVGDSPAVLGVGTYYAAQSVVDGPTSTRGSMRIGAFASVDVPLIPMLR